VTPRMDTEVSAVPKRLTAIMTDIARGTEGWHLHCTLSQMSASTIGLGGNLAKDERAKAINR
jgi:hypothetical protein